MPRSKPRSLPHFESIDALVRFFDTHDLGEYWDEMPEAFFDVDIRKRVHLIAVDADLADRVTEIAKARRVSSRSLINSWLRRKVAETR